MLAWCIRELSQPSCEISSLAHYLQILMAARTSSSSDPASEIMAIVGTGSMAASKMAYSSLTIAMPTTDSLRQQTGSLSP